jgi:protein-disulfide isomerase
MVKIDGWEDFARGGHRLGSEAAPITIIEFGDYQCPFCRDAEKHLAAILRKYPQEVSLVYRHFPLTSHQAALPAAQAAECADEQGAFWDYHRELLNRADWTVIGSEAFADIAAELGLPDLDAFVRCIMSPDPVDAITADRLAATRIGVNATPTFIVNGLRLSGAMDSIWFDTLREDLPRR